MEDRRFPKELLDKLKDFVLTFIGDNFIDGVTYALFFDKEAKIIEKCKDIFLDSSDYFGENVVMREIKVCNGVVYDVDMSVVGFILKDWIDNQDKSIDLPPYAELIGNQPETRREEDIRRFSKLCYGTYQQGKRKLEVALCSLSTLPSIIIAGRDKEDNAVSLYYPAFAIRQWDMERVNKDYLIKNNIRVNKLEVCDILPSREGVRYVIHLTELTE